MTVEGNRLWAPKLAQYWIQKALSFFTKQKQNNTFGLYKYLLNLSMTSKEYEDFLWTDCLVLYKYSRQILKIPVRKKNQTKHECSMWRFLRGITKCKMNTSVLLCQTSRPICGYYVFFFLHTTQSWPYQVRKHALISINYVYIISSWNRCSGQLKSNNHICLLMQDKSARNWLLPVPFLCWNLVVIFPVAIMSTRLTSLRIPLGDMTHEVVFWSRLWPT